MDIKTNLKKVLSQIDEACKKSGRDRNEIKLVAVSKFHPVEEIKEAMAAGQFLFGENRVQEAKEKFTILMSENTTTNDSPTSNDSSSSIQNPASTQNMTSHNSPAIDLHIIGSLQRNKVKDAVKIASCIESVDRIELLDEIEKQCAKINKKISILFELHTGEESKSGFESVEKVREALNLFAQIKYPHIEPKGFMTMAPFTEDKDLIRKSFVTLRECRDMMQKEFAQFDLKELSMGMSADFEIAIEEGSTMVRVGTSIFGPRNYN